MIIKSNHSFHLVDQRPWPLTAALGAIILTSGIVKWFHFFDITLILIGLTLLLITTYQWWRDISREGTYQGLHSNIVSKGLRWGIILFITSEVLFFFSFFWAFFHSSLSPTREIGLLWPPIGVSPFNALQVPLLNTIILLSSGVTVTWAHHSLIENNHSQTFQGLLLTIILGIYFTILQGLEYWEASFSISDSVYGATFFVATGFHGLHVLIGTTFLVVCLLRHNKCQFSSSHHFGFEAAAWYWHFVDVVWLFLYIRIYWWGRYFFNICLVYLISIQKVL
jgi:cytochrome c oxidase subunit 3